MFAKKVINKLNHDLKKKIPSSKHLVHKRKKNLL